MIKFGVVMNIIFCSLLSIPIITLPITLPAIVLNAMLLIPRVDTKRYYAFWKFIPITLTMFLALLVSFIVFFSVTSLEDSLNGFLRFVDKYIIFWNDKETLSSLELAGTWLKIFEIVILSIGSIGSGLVLFGWYKGKEIGQLEVEKSSDKSIDEKKEK